jgi:hypothetical protein
VVYGETWERDQRTIPIIVSDYKAGTKFSITVEYRWDGLPVHRDFTVKVYSQFTGVNILDSNSETKISHFNGSSPSGFTNSNYKGMTSSCSAFNSPSSNPT